MIKTQSPSLSPRALSFIQFWMFFSDIYRREQLVENYQNTLLTHLYHSWNSIPPPDGVRGGVNIYFSIFRLYHNDEFTI